MASNTRGGETAAKQESQQTDGNENDAKEDLSKMTRQDLFMRITEIWQEKKKFNSKLVELANEIESKRGEIKEIKTKIAIEGNELNIMGLEIQKIENKIKELT